MIHIFLCSNEDAYMKTLGIIHWCFKSHYFQIYAFFCYTPSHQKKMKKKKKASKFMITKFNSLEQIAAAFWKWFCANSPYWSCITQRRVGNCCELDSGSKRRGYPFIVSIFVKIILFIIKHIFSSNSLLHAALMQHQHDEYLFFLT